MTTAREAVEESGLVEALMDAELAARIAADLEADRGRWVWDADVDGVVGLQIRGQLGWETVVVLYLEHEDFECNARYAAGGEF